VNVSHGTVDHLVLTSGCRARSDQFHGSDHHSGCPGVEPSVMVSVISVHQNSDGGTVVRRVCGIVFVNPRSRSSVFSLHS